ncbi:peroxide stress protein YaaA [Microbacterium sp. KUDC0406]|uniref:YaaA family protein n=1 Tax=Microbacterium sp. KUDC0406 TaxID=2909588 RepID=UPI001F406AA4|nr:peroxide stress protein YaaA [Microbacterium sp. KUDC0406]UJP11365.1 peroxide stress protein YaaA [Microbacterium sp. KUDC0406]
MRILLPPSETKRPGGSGAVLDLDALALPSLRERREATVDALVALSTDPQAAQRVLKLSTRQAGDVDLNRTLRTAATMPAIDRYTGVLYDALDAGSLDARSRRWLGAHVLVHSAPFGPVGALDPIPSYRLAAGTALPGIPPMRRHWAQATSDAMGEERFVLDLRSEAYVALGPVPATVKSEYVRVVTPTGRALNHFNKKSKGELVRRLALSRPRVGGSAALLNWASAHGVLLRRAAPGTLELVVDE